jgi:hypothetical protein
MGKRQMRDKEYDQLQRLKDENRKLKQEISRLRKMTQHTAEYSDRLKKLTKQQYKEELDYKSKKEQIIEKWSCHKCNQGVLKIIIVSRADGQYYFRSCNICDNRTKIKAYEEAVEGITA